MKRVFAKNGLSKNEKILVGRYGIPTEELGVYRKSDISSIKRKTLKENDMYWPLVSQIHFLEGDFYAARSTNTYIRVGSSADSVQIPNDNMLRYGEENSQTCLSHYLRKRRGGCGRCFLNHVIIIEVEHLLSDFSSSIDNKQFCCESTKVKITVLQVDSRVFDADAYLDNQDYHDQDQSDSRGVALRVKKVFDRRHQ